MHKIKCYFHYIFGMHSIFTDITGHINLKTGLPSEVTATDACSSQCYFFSSPSHFFFSEHTVTLTDSNNVCSFPSTGLERDKFDNKTVTFEEHIKEEHNMWHYLFFIVLVKVKDSTEYTGPESYVAEMIKVNK